MAYTAKAAVRSEIRTKHSTQNEHHVEILMLHLKYVRKPLGFSRLKIITIPLLHL
jgi:hypothetical protein